MAIEAMVRIQDKPPLMLGSSTEGFQLHGPWMVEVTEDMLKEALETSIENAKIRSSFRRKIVESLTVAVADAKEDYGAEASRIKFCLVHVLSHMYTCDLGLLLKVSQVETKRLVTQRVFVINQWLQKTVENIKLDIGIHVEVNDFRHEGLCEAAKALRASRLYMVSRNSSKRGWLKGPGKSFLRCAANLPPGCILQHITDGKKTSERVTVAGSFSLPPPASTSLPAGFCQEGREKEEEVEEEDEITASTSEPAGGSKRWNRWNPLKGSSSSPSFPSSSPSSPAPLTEAALVRKSPRDGGRPEPSRAFPPSFSSLPTAPSPTFRFSSSSSSSASSAASEGSEGPGKPHPRSFPEPSPPPPGPVSAADISNTRTASNAVDLQRNLASAISSLPELIAALQSVAISVGEPGPSDRGLPGDRTAAGAPEPRPEAAPDQAPEKKTKGALKRFFSRSESGGGRGGRSGESEGDSWRGSQSMPRNGTVTGGGGGGGGGREGGKAVDPRKFLEQLKMCGEVLQQISLTNGRKAEGEEEEEEEDEKGSQGGSRGGQAEGEAEGEEGEAEGLTAWGMQVRHPDLRVYSPDEISSACEGFSEGRRVGEGGFGEVYVGEVDCMKVAVKRVRETAAAMEGFRVEVDIHTGLRHPNVVQFIGCCCVAPRPCLVTEFMPQGSLYDRLVQRNGSPPLHWTQRFEIFEDACRGLLYLHSRDPPIIHRDIKPENILLDKNFVAKIADIGLAHVMRDSDASYVQFSGAVGSSVYADPEYVKFGKVGPSSDVHSLGMVLIDLLGGLGISGNFRRRGKFIDDLKGLLRQEDARKVLELLDPSAGNWAEEVGVRLSRLAMDCIHFSREERPDLGREILPLLESLGEVVSADLEKVQKQRNDMEREEVEQELRFICPITREVMEEPVIAGDGHNYERKAIEEWLQSNDRSPITNGTMMHKFVTPNFDLKSDIQEWREKRVKRGAALSD